MADDDRGRQGEGIWYHGSPHALRFLRRGSTITRDRRLAEMFSHRPTAVVREGGVYRHDGRAPGHLYRVAGPLREGDVYQHPRSSMPPGSEFLTRRVLPLALIEVVPVDPTELLPAERAQELTAARRARSSRSKPPERMGKR